MVALVPLDAERFNVTPPIEYKGNVFNFSNNRHGMEGYLVDPVMTQRIALDPQGG